MSGGQRQRLGIARALYNNPEVIVFDEATSSLDTKTEKEVSQAIEELAGEKTLIIISHRFSTIRKYDRIFFMENGAIVDSDTFEELLTNNADFKRLAGAEAL